MDNCSCCGATGTPSKTQLRNAKKRAKAFAKREAKRQELHTAEPVIETLLGVLHDPKADIFLIKRVLDKISFHDLYEELALLDTGAALQVLDRVITQQKWNKTEMRILNVVLPIACVIGDEIRKE